MNVTDGDRERARELADLAYQSGYDQQFEPKPRDITDEQVIDAIATALAEERERAQMLCASTVDNPPVGSVQCARPEGHDGRHMYDYERPITAVGNTWLLSPTRRAAEESQ